MKRSGLLALAAAAGALGWVGPMGCRSDDQATAIVVEVVPGDVDAATLDAVVFHVSGPGLDAGGREARAGLRGPGARTFPLRLALVRAVQATGPFTVQVVAYGGGAVRAMAVDDEAIAFETGKVVTRRLVLRAVGEPGGPPADAGPVPPPPPPEPVAGPDAAMAAVPPAEASAPPDTAPPPVGPDPVSPGTTCDGCDEECVTRPTTLACLPAPDGTACHGNSGMKCRACHCNKEGGGK